MPSIEEEFVFNLLKERFNLNIDYIEKQKSVVTPDYVVMVNGKEAAVLELKNLTEAFGAQEFRDRGFEVDEFENEIFLARKLDTTSRRVASALKKAANQLKSYNLLRIIVLLDESGIDYHDIMGALDGSFHYDSEIGPRGCPEG